MLAEQLFRQLRYTAQAMVWEGTANKVFGDKAVIITAGGFPMEQLSRLYRPCLIINDGGGTNHLEHPLIFDQTIEMLLFIDNIGSVYGEGSLIGGNRTAQTESHGAGLLQIENEILKTFGIRGKVGGNNIALLSKTGSKAIQITGNLPLIYRGYTFQSRISTYGGYDLPPVRNFSVSGSVDLAWDLPKDAASRFDFESVLIIRKQNSVPSGYTDGTQIYQGSGTSITDSPGSGTWYYAAFTEYDEDEDGTIDNRSSLVSDSITI